MSRGPVAAGSLRSVSGDRSPAAGSAGLTARGQRTRERLLVAARQVFERDGYHDTRVTDISKAARVAHGTFYTYFDSKEDVFRQVLRRMQDDMHSRRSSAPRGLSAAERIAHANRGYMEEYRRNARMIGIMEQAASADELGKLRRDLRGLANLRSSRAIARWQKEGLVDASLDATLAASALGSMVDRSFYVWFVLGEPVDVEHALDTLNLLCARALGVEDIGPGRPRRRPTGRPPEAAG